MSRTTSKPQDWTEMVLKCDGNHGGPACGDPECWAIDWKIQCSSCLYKEVNRSNHWCYMFKDPPTDWCVPWRPVKTEGVPEDLSQATSPDPRDAEIAALRDRLQSIWQYGADTLSGNAVGPNNAAFYRESVVTMTKRADLDDYYAKPYHFDPGRARPANAAALAEKDAEIATLRAQLPEGMKDCTIQFLECEQGHGRLTAKNWVQNECPWCQKESGDE